MERRSILIVDDEATVTLALESFFHNKGFQVFRAFYGDQAIEQIDKEQPAVVILDLQMPGVNGIAVLEKIRESYPEIKTLVLTGYSDRYKEEIDRCKPDLISLKPISLEELTRSVESLLGQKQKAFSSKGKTPQRIRLLFLGGMEELYRQVLKPYFEDSERRAQYETTLAREPAEAFHLLEQFRPHLVVLDSARLPIGVDAGKLAADLGKAPTPPLEVIIHTFRSPAGAAMQPPADRLGSLEDSIQQVAQRHQLFPTVHGG